MLEINEWYLAFTKCFQVPPRKTLADALGHAWCIVHHLK